MGVTIPGGGVTTVGVVSGFQLLSPGILTQVALRSDKIFQAVGEQYWSLHLCDSKSVDDNIDATLCSGYIQYPNALTWEGFLELPAQKYMIIEGVGINTQTASAVETRITLTLNGQLSQFLVNVQKESRLS